MKKRLAFLCVFFLSTSIFLNAADTDEDIFSEDDIFSDDDIIVESEEITDETISEELDQESVTFSGEMNAEFNYFLTRDFLWGVSDFEENPYLTGLYADLMLDVRLQKGFKAFADLAVAYLPQKITTTHYFTDITYTTLPYLEEIDTVLLLKEFFVDVNISNFMYFRVGKQVLVWGRGYFWNPTDLINRDKKSFLDLQERREGIYGLKITVPFGNNFHLYGFIDATAADSITDYAFAGKAEVLIGTTEMAVSAWAKQNKVPVFGFDISTSVWDIDLWGELSISYGDNIKKLNTQGGEETIEDELVPRFSVGLSKSFDFLDVSDRITITTEFYYNHAGYSDNMFAPATRDTFINGNYYSQNNYGQYYAALFFTLKKFIVSDINLNIRTIANFSDLSCMIMGGITYSPVYNFEFQFGLLGYLGEKNREYTYTGNAFGAILGLSMVF